MPPLAALLADAPRELRRDQRPPLGAVAANERHDRDVLLGGPLALDEVRVEHLLPAVEALDVGAVVEVGRFAFFFFFWGGGGGGGVGRREA